VCEVCGKERYGRPDQKYCGEHCRKEAASRRGYEKNRLEYIADPRIATCKECGGIFCPLYGSWLRSFCGDECRDLYFRRISRDRRRARLRGSEQVDNIDPIEVFERDGWHCYLCGQRTPREARGTLADNAPELEHIVPLAAGGMHTYDNVACCCRGCNQAKGAATLEQYAEQIQATFA
jgi:hypothetical protein